MRHALAADEIPRLAARLGVDAVFANHDYEPQAIARDAAVEASLRAGGQRFFSFKDQLIFEKGEVPSLGGQPFSVFTPYKNAWLKRLAAEPQRLAPFMVEPHAERLAPARSGCRN